MSHAIVNDFRIEQMPNTNGRLIKIYPKCNAGLPVKVDVDNRFCVSRATFVEVLDRIHNFEVRKDDVWVITMPKAGTTWMLELTWLLVNNLDFETALNVEQEERCPFIDFCMLIPSSTSIEDAENLKSPRVIKSHLPMHLLPKALWTVQPRIIYVARDPKDVSISSYHFTTALGINERNQDDSASRMLRNESGYSPFWWHVVEFWKIRNEPYIYFTSFERMKKDLRTIVLHVSKFIQTPTIDDEQMEKLLDHLSFNKMKDNPMCNHVSEMNAIQKSVGANNNKFKFVRQGIIGSHKNNLSSEMIEQFNQWTHTSLEPFGVTSDEILYS